MKWLSALGLEQWAEKLNAKSDFPGVVLDLVRASAENFSSYRFPQGDKGQVRGYDGLVECERGDAFVPAGRSIWEIGLEKDYERKANGEYKKRTAALTQEERSELTFVFATPRSWNKTPRQREDWVAKKKALKEWRDVRYIDGVQFEHWLDEHPAVAARYAKEFGFVPQTGASSADEFWEEYSQRFSPPLVEEVLLAGREAQAEALLRKLSEEGSKLAYVADTPDEVIAFAIAVVRKAPPEMQKYLKSRMMVVDSEQAARFLKTRKGLIYLPRGQARKLAGTLESAGTTIINAGVAEPRASHHVVLPRPNSTQLGAALEVMGFRSEGYDRARRCGRSLAVLARQIPSATAELPEWVADAEALMPAMLAGAWQASEPDKSILVALAGKDKYDAVEAPLRKLSWLNDPPVDQVGDVWAMRSSVDAFLHLARYIGQEHLERFEKQTKLLFSKEVQRPRPEDLFKLSSEKNEAYSSWLKEGIMTTLLHMSVLHEEANFSVIGSTPRAFVNGLVGSLPGLLDYRFFASFKENMPLLAEAAPDPFLEALERMLEGDGASIKPIFDETKSFFTTESHHTGLLFSLEVLAWDFKHLLRVAICLAKLAIIDPGGSLSNRPINSLREIFLAWNPNTNATAAQRNGILDALIRTVPDIAWPLLEKLLPNHRAVSCNTARPKFGEAEPGGGEELNYAVVWSSELLVVQRAVEYVGTDETRWIALIDRLRELQPDAFEVVMNALEPVLNRESLAGNSAIWDVLRKETNRNRAFADADWALNTENIARLEDLVEKYSPQDQVTVAKWLFDEWIPSVPGLVEDADDPMKAIEDARFSALSGVFRERGIAGLIRLANVSTLPLQMQEALSKLDLAVEDIEEALYLLIVERGNAFALAAFFVAHGVRKFSDDFLFNVQSLCISIDLSPTEFASLLVGLNDTRITWEFISALGKEIEDEYWKQKFSPIFSGSIIDLAFLLETYVAHGRVLGALEVAVRRVNDVPTSTLLRLLELSLKEVNAAERNIGPIFGHYVGIVLDSLSTRDDVDESDLASREFALLPVLRKSKRPLALHSLIKKSPALFIDAICAVYKPDKVDAAQLSPDASALALARAAGELLRNLSTIPGQVEQDVDFNALSSWCNEVRRQAISHNRATVTDLSIGRWLAHSPPSGEDGAWPHQSVRRVLEESAANNIERGIQTERINMRGVFSRKLGEGGEQERGLAEQYRSWASAMSQYPRTAAMLAAIAESWVRQGKEADLRAAQQELRG